MWQCPKCGREFKNQNQDHFCGEPPETIDAYIALQPELVQPIPESDPRHNPRRTAGCAGTYFLAYANLLEQAQHHSFRGI